jgi:hypothetical protein
VGAQQQMAVGGLDEEGVLHGPGGVIGIEAERVEVEPLVLDLGPLGDLPAHADEDVGGLVLQLGEGVAGARGAAHGRGGHVDGLGDEARGGLLLGELGLAALVGALDAASRLAHELAGGRLLVLRHLAHEGVELRDRRGLAGVLGAGGLQLGDGAGRGEGGEGRFDGGVGRLLGDRVGRLRLLGLARPCGVRFTR